MWFSTLPLPCGSAGNSKQINWLRKAKKKKDLHFFFERMSGPTSWTLVSDTYRYPWRKNIVIFMCAYIAEKYMMIKHSIIMFTARALLSFHCLLQRKEKESANRRLRWIFISMCWLLNVIVVNLTRQPRRRYRPTARTLRTASDHSGCWVKSFGTGLLVQRTHSQTVSTAPSQLHTSTYEGLISIKGLKDSLKTKGQFKN